MSDKNIEKTKRMRRRKLHVRKSVTGTPERPRLAVYRSSKHIYAQVIDDTTGRTLAAAASTARPLLGEVKSGAGVAAAQAIGRAVAERARAAGVTRVCFDRGGRRYHGRVKALADAARQAGLQF